VIIAFQRSRDIQRFESKGVSKHSRIRGGTDESVGGPQEKRASSASASAPVPPPATNLATTSKNKNK
ncbi:unnamed protein product, partial [Amoebophrya sp. A25]